MINRLIFFQNFVSIHQNDTLKELAKYFEVYLVASSHIEANRLASGWNFPSLDGISFIDISDSDRVLGLCSDETQALYIFSGISAFKQVSAWLRFCLAKKRKVWVMLEPFDDTKVLSFVRKIKYWLEIKRYGGKIEALLPTGIKGCDLYSTLGFEKNRIFEWGYFVNPLPSLPSFPFDVVSSKNLKPSLIFVGELCERKRIVPLCKSIIDFERTINSFVIVGDGDHYREVNAFVSLSPKFLHIKSLPNSLVRSLIAKNDWLILPSRFDGWGTVVNEALLVGTRVVVSEDCGSASLIANTGIGIVFGKRRGLSLVDAIDLAIRDGITSASRRSSIADWSRLRISSEVAASYFASIVRATEGVSSFPIVPWRS